MCVAPEHICSRCPSCLLNGLDYRSRPGVATDSFSPSSLLPLFSVWHSSVPVVDPFALAALPRFFARRPFQLSRSCRRLRFTPSNAVGFLPFLLPHCAFATTPHCRCHAGVACLTRSNLSMVRLGPGFCLGLLLSLLKSSRHFCFHFPLMSASQLRIEEHRPVSIYAPIFTVLPSFRFVCL